jgi:hypothetical protein
MQYLKPRRSTRFRRRFRVELGHTAAFTVDVSAGGFCVELVRVLPPGSPLAGSIHVNGRELPFGGQVVWARQSAAGLNIRGRMGVRFTQPPPGLRQLIVSRGPTGPPPAPPRA